MGQPTDEERAILTGATLESPAFLAWAKKRGKEIRASTPYREIRDLLTEYRIELDRSEVELRRKGARAIRESADQIAYEEGLKNQTPALRLAVAKSWSYTDPVVNAATSRLLKEDSPLHKRVQSSHYSDKQRWAIFRNYHRIRADVFGEPLDPDALLEKVVTEELLYLKQQYRPQHSASSLRIKDWAAKRPMNPVANFEPGIVDYNVFGASEQKKWVDNEIKGYDVNSGVITIEYVDGSELEIPLSNELIFKDPPTREETLRTFARKHKTSGRIVPFVVYKNQAAGMSDLDVLDEHDLGNLGLPRFDGYLTPAILNLFSTDEALWEIARGLLKLYGTSGGMRGALRFAGGASRALATGYGVAKGTVGVVRSTGALVRSGGVQLRIAVSQFGFTRAAAKYLSSTAIAYYVANAPAINEHVTVGAEIVLDVLGAEMGPGSTGDMLQFAGPRIDDAVKGATKNWAAIEAEIDSVAVGAKEIRLRVTRVNPISEQTAQADYDLGKQIVFSKSATKPGATTGGRATAHPQVANNGTSGSQGIDDTQRLNKFRKPEPPIVIRKPLGKQKVQLDPDPRFVPDINELSKIQKKLANELPNLAGKYNEAALKKLMNFNADTIREVQIDPADLEKLYKKLNSAGKDTQQFINTFHDAPGFELVVLNWAKSSVWTKGRWKATHNMRNGTNFMMKFSNANLVGKKIHFEWPAGIKDTSWGDEVWARHVDVVIEGGTNVKPGGMIYTELKSWTERTLRQKAASGGVSFQLVRDTALFSKENIRWVFDAKKISKATVIAAFKEVIKQDEYLRHKDRWGSVDQAIEDALSQVIEVF